MQKYRKAGEIQLTSPRRPSAYVVVYCTYGGAHTGINEAIPAVKYMGQLFDHLGYTIMAEWYIVGEYKTEKYRMHSVASNPQCEPSSCINLDDFNCLYNIPRLFRLLTSNSHHYSSRRI